MKCQELLIFPMTWFVVMVAFTSNVSKIFAYPSTNSNEKPEIVAPIRVVTDLEIIFGCHGVPVQYWYNETKGENDTEVGSVPGCPRSIDGFPWVYYGDPPRCFLVRHRGPCPLGQKILTTQGSLNGICACECLAQDQTTQNEMQSDDKYLFCKKNGSMAAPHGQIFNKHTKDCYNTYQNGVGPCEGNSAIVGWDGDSIYCNLICDFTQPDWEQMAESGSCSELPAVTFNPSFTATKSEKDCLSDEKFSNVLKKCVKFFKWGSILG